MEIVAVTERKLCGRPFLEQIELIASSGADMIVLREKDLGYAEYRELAAEVMRICGEHDMKFCVNTFADIASEIGADTVWIPYAMLIEKGRPRLHDVGVSVHSLDEAVKAEYAGADFLIYGNVFETSCKPGKEAKGFSELDRIAESVKIPVYAIGGIGCGNASLLKSHKIQGICLRSAFMTSDDPEELVSALRVSTS